MKYDFIQVNKSILDYSEYMKRVMLLKNYLKMTLKEFLEHESFSLEQSENPGYDKTILTFYRQDVDLEIKIEIKKREGELFI